MFPHQIFFCILDEISLLEDPRWVWTQLPRSATSYTFSNVLFEKPLYSSLFRGGGLSERRAQPRLSTLALFVHLQHALLQAMLLLCTLSTLRDLQSTLVAHSQRWRVVLVSRSIVFAEAFMFQRMLLVSTLVFLVYYVTAICHVSVCSPASSLLLFSHLSHSFLLTPQCCRDLCFFLKSPLFVPFFTIFLLAPLASYKKTEFSKNRFSTWKLLIFLILINKKKKPGRGAAAAKFKGVLRLPAGRSQRIKHFYIFSVFFNRLVHFFFVDH